VVAIGLIAFALWCFIQALFDTEGKGNNAKGILARVGYAALGVVFCIVGLFLIIAAIQHNPNDARGLDSALQVLLQQPFGPFLLAIVALGLVAYGAYSFVEARYRRIAGHQFSM